MRLSAARILPFLSLSVIPFSRASYNHRHRQLVVSSSGAASSGSTTSVASATSAASTSSGASVVSGSSISRTSAAVNTSLPTPSFSLVSENPTAVPISSIIANASSAPVPPLPTPFAAGTKPSDIPNAPGLPSLSNFSPSNYPPLDTPPPTDSPQVQQWIQEVNQSGISIPGFSPTVPGGCPANPAAATDTTRCWWTCGGCTRSEDVTTCPQKYQWGLTYDDGPAYYTPELLSYMNQQSLTATMFVVGSRVTQFPALLQEEYLAGHQIAVHTWSHPSLTTQSTEQIIAELGWTRQVIRDVIGVSPLYMRPPYGDIDDRVRAICMAMNMYPVMWTRINATATFDTDDFDIHGGLTTVQQVLFNWENIITTALTMNNGFIVLEHDLFQQTVEVATGYILPDALARRPAFNITPVITCLDRPMSDAYVETNDNTTYPLPAIGTYFLRFEVSSL
ncbi:hypothetical protein BGY98DRAFT_913269 [Russula aff. rugulosa BPL654]|nr:hypothetical protein BGY98DRAFT_913269 [Russula aff. rugulosa BPL654]